LKLLSSNYHQKEAASSKLALPTMGNTKKDKKASRTAPRPQKRTRSPSPDTSEPKRGQGVGGGRTPGGKLVIVASPNSGEQKLKYVTKGSTEGMGSVKRRRQGANILSANSENMRSPPVSESSQWSQQRYESLKTMHAESISRTASLESAVTAYVEQLKGTFRALESQRNMMASFITTSNSIPPPPTLPPEPTWYSEMFSRKDDEARAALTKPFSGSSLSF
jgi:hypothetical protein